MAYMHKLCPHLPNQYRGIVFLFAYMFLAPLSVFAWDSQPDENGKYDNFFDRPTYFPDWQQPSEWPNAMYLLCEVQREDGSVLENYEILVYDQNGVVRHCNRSIAKDQHHCVLTIKGTEGDSFTFKVLYGDDFQNPRILSIPNVTINFKTNQTIGGAAQPFVLTMSEPTYLSENDTQLPADKSNTDVTLTITLNAFTWEAICLPFDLSSDQVKAIFGDDVLLADFVGCKTEFEDDNVTPKHTDVLFEYTEQIQANHPYIIKVSRDIQKIDILGVNIHAESQPSIKKDLKDSKYNQFIGNYISGYNIPKDALKLEGGEFVYSVGATSLKAYHAYFDLYNIIPEQQWDPTRIEISFDSGATAIENNLVKSPQSDIYDLFGRRVGEPARGIYIQNGRKYIVK